MQQFKFLARSMSVVLTDTAPQRMPLHDNNGTHKPNTDMAIIELSGVNKIYRTDKVETTALENVNISVEKGEFVSIMVLRDAESRRFSTSSVFSMPPLRER